MNTLRLFAVLSAYVCIAFSRSVIAATATVNGITWKYTVSDGKASIGDVRSWSSAIPESTVGAISIPSAIAGYQVTSIGDWAFYKCSGLTSITIPNSVTSVGNYAFDGCTGLSSLTVPANVDRLGNSVCSGCTSLTSILIQGNIATIGSGAFYNCQRITSIIIPDSVTDIGSQAFENCKNLGSVSFGKSVINIGSAAFRGCSSLVTMTIPARLSTIGNQAFERCSSLMSFSVNPDNSAFSAVSNMLLSKDCSELVCGVNGEDVVIPDGVISIRNCAFADYKGLRKVTIPGSVKSIGSWAFRGCSELKTVDIGDGFISLDQNPFENCNSALYDTSSISGITLVDGYVIQSSKLLSGTIDLTTVRGVFGSAFYACTNLTKVCFGENTIALGNRAFQDCTSLTNVSFEAGLRLIGSEAFSGCSNLATISIPESCECIASGAFDGCSESLYDTTSILGVTLVDGWAIASSKSLSGILNLAGIRGICGGAFVGCQSLTSVIIPDGVKSIGNYAFSGCSGLVDVIIPDSVITIERQAFYGCSGLLSVIIPNNVTNIGGSAFSGCNKLSSIIIPDSVTSIGSTAFEGCAMTSITIPRSVTAIGNGAFFNCTKLISVEVLGQSQIEKSFYNCSQIRKITIPGTCRLSDICNYYSSITNVSFSSGTMRIVSDSLSGCYGVRSVEIPEGVVRIGNGAFNGCRNLSHIIIPDSVEQIGRDAFRGCNASLCDTSSVVGVTLIDHWAVGYDGNLTTTLSLTGIRGIADHAFSESQVLTTLSLHEGVKHIGNSAFSGCSELRTITIPDSVRSIGNDAFSCCSNLAAVIVPDGITSIEDATFLGCSNLEFISIPNSVTSIGSSTFSGCRSIMSVTIPDSVTSIGSTIFSDCDNLSTIIIPRHLIKFTNSLTSGNSATVLVASPTTDNILPIVMFYASSLPVGQIGKRYATWIIADGESSDTVYSVSSGSLPAGLSLSPDGLLSGNPTEAVQNQSVTISTSDGQSHTFTITIHPVDYGWRTSGIWKYEVENDEAVIRRCTQTSGSIKVPESLGGYSVRTIEAPHVAAYDDFGSMTNIYIPTVVFESGISSITLPSNLRNLGVGAVAASSISSLTVPNGVTNVGAYAATLCRGLRNIQFGSGVRSIGDGAFTDCTALQSASIPSTVHELGIGIFERCSGLLSASVFSDCGFLPSSTFKDCAALQSVNLATSITNVKSLAFAGCSQLQGIDLPDGVREIGFGAFANCVSLDAFSCPENLERIMGSCFLGCTTLPGISLNGNLASIWTNAFANCTSLQEISIPDSVTMVGPGAFSGCSNMRAMSIPFTGISKTETGGTEWSGFGAIFGTGSYEGCVAVTQRFDDQGEHVATWQVPGSLRTVEFRGDTLQPGAFSGCLMLDEISLTGTITNIPAWAFERCNSIRHFEIPESIMHIGFSAFGDCSALESIRMPVSPETIDSMESIDGVGVFNNCANLAEVTWDATGSLRLENSDSGYFNLWSKTVAEDFLTWCVVPSQPRCKVEWFPEYMEEPSVVDVVAGVRIGETRSFHVRVTPMTATAADSDRIFFIDPDSSSVWCLASDETSVGGLCLRSDNEISANETSSIETTLIGPGTLSFQWKVPAGRGDYARVYLDGEVQKNIQRVTAWQTVSLDIPAGEHTIRWSYERGSGSATGEDAAFLDDVDWRPEVSLSVASEFGTVTPDAGTHTLVYGDEVAASVVTPEPENGTRRVCTGWRGLGSAPAMGTGDSVSFTITNETSIVWNWRTDYLTGVSVSGGSGGFDPQWVASGETVEVALSPAAHLYEISLSGDTEGVTLDGTKLCFVADRPRQINATITEVKLTLAVGSEWGVPSPTNGVRALSWGTLMSASVAEPEPTNGVQYVCTGWTGMGSVPESGTGTNIAFTIESDSSIQWNWQTNVWISVAANGPVGVDVADGWFALGDAVVAQYSPNVDFFTLALSGDTDGVVLDESARTIAIPADRPRSVTLSIAELTLKKALDAGSLTWGTSGNATWFPQIEVSADGVSSARSGGLSNGDEVSALETTVQGGGTFAWSWRLGVSGDSNSGVDVLLDGEWLDAYYPGTDWSRETLEITGDGEHTIRFEFWNAGTETGDCAYLDQVSWSGGVPSHDIAIGDVRIPSDWIEEKAASALAKANGDYEAAANATAANGINKVWECYVAGISPTDETARFEATIEIVDGKPVVRWNPPLSAEEESKRTRKILGRPSLDDSEGWQDISSLDDPEAAGYRFFKVSVEMK